LFLGETLIFLPGFPLILSGEVCECFEVMASARDRLWQSLGRIVRKALTKHARLAGVDVSHSGLLVPERVEQQGVAFVSACELHLFDRAGKSTYRP
jgi:hypothetical protein